MGRRDLRGASLVFHGLLRKYVFIKKLGLGWWKVCGLGNWLVRRSFVEEVLQAMQ